MDNQEPNKSVDESKINRARNIKTGLIIGGVVFAIYLTFIIKTGLKINF